MMLRLVTSFAIAAGLAASAMAQTAGTTNMEILRQKIKADKKLVVAQNLKLTDAEGTAFWPVYDAYQKDLQAINQRMTAVILAYADAYNKGPVTNETAKKLLDESLAPVRTAFSDLTMLVMAAGQERTTDEYRSLLAAAGFDLTRTVSTGTDVCIIEAVPAQ